MVIELGTATVRAFEPGRGGSGPRALVLGREEPGSPYGAVEIGRLVRAARRSGMTAGEAVVMLPKRAVRSVPVDLPPRESGAPLEQIAAAQAVEALGLAAGEFELAITTHGRGGKPGTAGVCVHGEAVALAEWFEGAGLWVRAMLPPSAILAAAASGHAGVSLVLDAGWTDTTIAAAADGALLLERRIASVSFGRVVAEVGRSLGGMSRAAALVCGPGRHADLRLAELVAGPMRAYGLGLSRELSATVPYIEQVVGEAPRRVVVIGRAAEDEELVEWLSLNSEVAVVSGSEPGLPMSFAPLASIAAMFAGPAVRGRSVVEKRAQKREASARGAA